MTPLFIIGVLVVALLVSLIYMASLRMTIRNDAHIIEKLNQKIREHYMEKHIQDCDGHLHTRPQNRTYRNPVNTD